MSLVRSDRAQFIPPEKSKSKHIYVCDKRAEGKKCAEFLLIMSLSFHRVFSFSFVCICVCVCVHSYYYDSSRIKFRLNGAVSVE